MKNIWILALMLCAAMSGCATVNTVERADSQSRKDMVSDKRIITDSDLDDYAYVAGLNQSVVGNLLKVQAKIVNSTVAQRSINYKFSWFDQNGMEIESPNTPWSTLILEGGESGYISSVAPSPNAKDFSLKLFPNIR